MREAFIALFHWMQDNQIDSDKVTVTFNIEGTEAAIRFDAAFRQWSRDMLNDQRPEGPFVCSRFTILGIKGRIESDFHGK